MPWARTARPLSSWHPGKGTLPCARTASDARNHNVLIDCCPQSWFKRFNVSCHGSYRLLSSQHTTTYCNLTNKSIIIIDNLCISWHFISYIYTIIVSFYFQEFRHRTSRPCWSMARMLTTVVTRPAAIRWKITSTSHSLPPSLPLSLLRIFDRWSCTSIPLVYFWYVTVCSWMAHLWMS